MVGWRGCSCRQLGRLGPRGQRLQRRCTASPGPRPASSWAGPRASSRVHFAVARGGRHRRVRRRRRPLRVAGLVGARSHRRLGGRSRRARRGGRPGPTRWWTRRSATAFGPQVAAPDPAGVEPVVAARDRHPVPVAGHHPRPEHRLLGRRQLPPQARHPQPALGRPRGRARSSSTCTAGPGSSATSASRASRSCTSSSSAAGSACPSTTGSARGRPGRRTWSTASGRWPGSASHIAEYGGDPNFIAISGGSAGGHLAALVALTPGRPEWQPGFEEADTSVDACLPFYGVYDMTGAPGLSGTYGRGLLNLLEHRVMKAAIADDPALFEAASPDHQVTAEAPPMFVVHGAQRHPCAGGRCPPFRRPACGSTPAPRWPTPSCLWPSTPSRCS